MATSNYPLHHSAKPENNPAAETVKDAVTGHDKPMEEKHPNAPAALVFASYPIVLAIGVVLMILLYWLLS